MNVECFITGIGRMETGAWIMITAGITTMIGIGIEIATVTDEKPVTASNSD